MVETSPALKDYQRHPVFWYTDGNVALASKPYVFRVHQSILTRHSPVFQETFQSMQEQHTYRYEGCPAVHVPDSVFALSELFRLLYSEGERLNGDKAATLEQIAAWLQVGQRYEIHWLSGESIRRLEVECPSYYPGVENLRSREQPVIQDIGQSGEKYILILNLLRKQDLNDLVPWCLYMCAQLPVETLVGGVDCPDSRKERLSEQDLITCLKGKQGLIHAAMAVADEFRSDGVNCDSPRCQKEMEKWERKRVFSEMKETFFQPDPLGSRNVLFPVEQLDFCKSCQKNIDYIREKQQQEIFSSLSAYFGLE